MSPIAASPARPTVSSLRHGVNGTLAVMLSCVVLAGPASALPPANSDGGGGDPAPRPLLNRPAPAPRPAPAADTVALMPPGQYVMRLTLKGETLERPLKIVRSGTSITAAMGGGDMLNGTLDATGRLQLAGGNATDRIELGAMVTNGRASGQAQLGRGTSRMNGSFTLDPELQGARKPQQWGATGPKSNEGFFDRLSRAWNCLKNWSTC